MFTALPVPTPYVFLVQPYDQRDYNIVQFKKIQGRWFYILNISTPYRHPLPIFNKIGDDEIDYMNPGFHCNFRKNPNSCGDDNLCWQCFADLNWDESLCQNLDKKLEEQKKEIFKKSIAHSRNQCIQTVAIIKMDPKICDNLPEEGFNSKTKCREHISRFTLASRLNYLPSINLIDVDSDKDGLTDVKERLFNTSIRNADTDGDGASDFEEIMVAFTNPLGEGRLGDHLKPVKPSRFIWFTNLFNIIWSYLKAKYQSITGN